MNTWPFKVLLGSFAFFTILTGGLWLAIPEKLSDLVAGAASAYAIDVGHARGAGDFAMGVVAAMTLWLRHSPGRQMILLSLVVMNTLLLIAGTVAQLTELATPARWVVYFLHVGWAVGFARYYVLGRRQTYDVHANR